MNDEAKIEYLRDVLITVHEKIQELLPVDLREQITGIIAEALDKTV